MTMRGVQGLAATGLVGAAEKMCFPVTGQAVRAASD